MRRLSYDPKCEMVRITNDQMTAAAARKMPFGVGVASFYDNHATERVHPVISPTPLEMARLLLDDILRSDGDDDDFEPYRDEDGDWIAPLPPIKPEYVVVSPELNGIERFYGDRVLFKYEKYLGERVVLSNE